MASVKTPVHQKHTIHFGIIINIQKKPTSSARFTHAGLWAILFHSSDFMTALEHFPLFLPQPFLVDASHKHTRLFCGPPA